MLCHRSTAVLSSQGCVIVRVTHYRPIISLSSHCCVIVPMTRHRPSAAVSSSQCCVIVPVLLCHPPSVVSSSQCCCVIILVSCYRPSAVSSSQCCVIDPMTRHRSVRSLECSVLCSVSIAVFCRRTGVFLDKAPKLTAFHLPSNHPPSFSNFRQSLSLTRFCRLPLGITSGKGRTGFSVLICLEPVSYTHLTLPTMAVV